MKTGPLGALLLALLALLSLFVGAIQFSPRDLFSNPEAAQLLAISRFPRTAAAMLTGATMAICGQILQTMVRNRFVEPMTAGTGQAAGLGILLTAMLFPAGSIAIKMTFASLTALLGSLGFLLIVRRLPPTQPLLVPLVGLVYGGIISAATTFVAYQADLLQFIDIWMNGEFSGTLRGRYELLWFAGAVAAAVYLIADQFSIVGLGRDASVNLGLNYEQIMLLGLLAIAVVSALTVVTVGLIPFVGLVVPNIVSRHMGDNLRLTLPTTALLGAGLVLACDLLGRVVRYPFEVPVGTVTGVIGTCLFLWLLYARPVRAH